MTCVADEPGARKQSCQSRKYYFMGFTELVGVSATYTLIMGETMADVREKVFKM